MPAAAMTSKNTSWRVGTGADATLDDMGYRGEDVPGPHGDYAGMEDAVGPEWVALVLLSVLVVLFGLVPSLALSRIDSSVVALLDRLGVLP